MDKKVKQRLVGAIVLIIFACVLIPIVFHRSSIKSENIAMSPLAAEAPAKPQLMPAVERERTALEHQKIVISKQQLAADQKQALKYFESSAKSKTVPSKKVAKKQWFLQLASFDDLIHAKRLQAEMKKHDMNAQIITAIHVKANKRYDIYRVVLGPVQTQKQAQALQQKIYKLTNLKGLILSDNA